MKALFTTDESLLLRIAPDDLEYAQWAGRVASALTGRRLRESDDPYVNTPPSVTPNSALRILDRPILPCPDIDQPNDFTCIPFCCGSICRGLGIGPEDPKEYPKLLGTTREDSTKPERVIDLFKQLGCPLEARPDMTIDDLRKNYLRGWYTLCLIQEYGVETKAQPYGHGVVVVFQGHGHVIVQDPSVDYTRHPQKTLAVPGKMLISNETFLKAWWQKQDDIEYRRYGIAVGPPVRETRESKDASGHEHKGPGEGGGQFTSGESGGGASKTTPAQSAHAQNQAQQRKHTTIPELDRFPSTHEELHQKASEIADHLSEKAESILQKFAGPAKWVRGKTEELRGKLIERYGVRTTASIFAAGQIITWSISIGAPILTHLPIVVPPGGGLATTLALAGCVEAYRKIRGMMSGKQNVVESLESEELSAHEIMLKAVEMVNELIRGAHEALEAAKK